MEVTKDNYYNSTVIKSSSLLFRVLALLVVEYFFQVCDFYLFLQCL